MPSQAPSPLAGPFAGVTPQIITTLTLARKYSRQKDKPEPRMAQGKRKEALCKEVEMLPPRNFSRESDDE